MNLLELPYYIVQYGTKKSYVTRLNIIEINKYVDVTSIPKWFAGPPSNMADLSRSRVSGCHVTIPLPEW